MRVKVTNECVRNNVELFKISLRRLSEEKEGAFHPCRMTVAFYVDLQTAKMSFAGTEKLSTDAYNLKKFEFLIFSKSKKAPRLELKVDEDLLFAELDAKVHFILDQTIRLIQTMGRLLPIKERISESLLDFSSIQLDLVKQAHHEHQPDIIHSAWHQVGRTEAEKMLLLKDVGTFLFRKDPYATILENELKRAHKKDVSCVTISYLDLERRVCEYTLVKVEDGWLIYRGDPSLVEPIYPCMDVFLDHMKGVLKQPLLHTER